MRTVGNVVEGAMPKQTIETIPRRTVIITLRWSLMIDFKNPQNYKKKQKGKKNSYYFTHSADSHYFIPRLQNSSDPLSPAEKITSFLT